MQNINTKLGEARGTDDRSGPASLAHQHDFSVQAVAAMRDALVRGNGTLAQFDHPEFGGGGQWMQGGMIMIGDPSDQQLKARVDALCHALSNSLAQLSDSGGVSAAGAQAPRGKKDAWWPDNLSAPTITGRQNTMRYAYFAAARRLAIDDDGRTVVYDTQDHRINGVAQQQSTAGSLTFSSQHGAIDLSRLPVV